MVVTRGMGGRAQADCLETLSQTGEPQSNPPNSSWALLSPLLGGAQGFGVQKKSYLCITDKVLNHASMGELKTQLGQ